jgi:hypothetical protein
VSHCVQPHILVAVSDKGRVAQVCLRPEFYDQLIKHRFDAGSQPEEHGMETLIFKRQFREAFDTAFALTKRISSAAKTAQALSLLELCTPLKKQAWSYEGEDDLNADNASNQFEEDLDNFSYFIPDKFPIPVQELVWLSFRCLLNYFVQIPPLG